ncbi:BTAD domain-containing putative transcriptional regulator [Nonomuraea sp. NPDC049028]|uniref:AfsR/SARP family transcriptional regulator n=1 Tax=Nonomuraea sp. NPDC049028 TaxID=3364348 RepID=UPI003720ABF4
METGTGIRFSVLGPLEITRGGRPVRLSAAKQRIALATLLVNANHHVPPDKLIEYVWGDDVPKQARAALHTQMTRLRRALDDGADGRPLIETMGAGYILRADADTLDVERFRELAGQATLAAGAGDQAGESGLLREALALWRGPVLVDVVSESLHRDEVPRLGEERMRLLERWFDLGLRTGRHEEIIADLKAATAEHPLRERLWEQLVLALHLAERRAEALEVYRHVAALLREELGIDPGSDLRRLQQAVLNGIPLTTTESAPAEPATYPPAPVPRQLPSDLARFTGRHTDLAKLYDLLPEEGEHRPIVIAAIGGAGGVGKTALAVHWAHQVRERFPDGQLHIDLRGFGPGEPMAPATALEMMLRSLNVPADQIPTAVEARSALLRSTLAGRRVLVLLDNARNTAQVRPLLPGSDCLVLVTSRTRLAGLAVHDDARHVFLSRLPEAESYTLLGKILGAGRVSAEAEAAAELARLCAHLPLALAISAEHVTRRSGARLADLVAQLRDERSRLDLLDVDDDPQMSLRAVFSWSYQALDPRAARAFRLLGLHSGTEFGVGAAAALIGVPPAEARRLAEILTDRCLLETGGVERYRMHDLMRVYAGERVEAEESDADRLAAVKRLLSWYLHTVDQADQVLNPQHQGLPLPPLEPSCEPYTFSGYDAALCWLQTEHANLMAAVRRAFTLGQYGVAWQLPCALWSFFNLRKHWDSWISSNEIGLEAALLLGDAHAEATIRTSLALAHWDRRQFKDALPHAEIALALQRDLGDRWGQGNALNTLGLVHRDLDAAEAAVVCHREALAIFTDLGYHWGQAIASAGLGRALLALGQPRTALQHHLSALAAFRAIDNLWGEGIALTDMCITYAALGDHEETIRWCFRSLDRSREIGDCNTEARTLHILGQALAATGCPVLAVETWRRSLTIFDHLADSEAAQVRADIAEVEAETGFSTESMLEPEKAWLSDIVASSRVISSR